MADLPGIGKILPSKFSCLNDIAILKIVKFIHREAMSGYTLFFITGPGFCLEQNSACQLQANEFIVGISILLFLRHAYHISSHWH